MLAIAASRTLNRQPTGGVRDLYVVVHHTILDAETAFTRGQRLMIGEGAPQGVRVLQFYPSVDHSLVICLWESSTVEDVQAYVDATLGDSSENVCAVRWIRTRPSLERPLGPTGERTPSLRECGGIRYGRAIANIPTPAGTARRRGRRRRWSPRERIRAAAEAERSRAGLRGDQHAQRSPPPPAWLSGRCTWPFRPRRRCSRPCWPGSRATRRSARGWPRPGRRVGHVLPLFARANAARLGRVGPGMLGSGDDRRCRSAAVDIVAVLASWRALAGDVGSTEAAAIIEATASAPVYLRLVETGGWQATEYAAWLVRVLAASLLDIVRQ